MLPEIGHFALILALLLAAAQAFFGLAGPALGRDRWLAVVGPAVTGQFVMVSAAIGTLLVAFVQNDFSVAYVAQNSNSALPVFYRIAALWGAHEGSLLLWGWILAAWTLAVALRSRQLPARFAARVLGVEVPQPPGKRIALTASGASHKMSMLQDLEKGKPLELDILEESIGEVRRLSGLEMPTLEMVLEMARLRAMQMSTNTSAGH